MPAKRLPTVVRLRTTTDDDSCAAVAASLSEGESAATRRLLLSEPLFELPQFKFERIEDLLHVLIRVLVVLPVGEVSDEAELV
jgi:hypothetical protein